jgi:hypothetical protein
MVFDSWFSSISLSPEAVIGSVWSGDWGGEWRRKVEDGELRNSVQWGMSCGITHLLMGGVAMSKHIGLARCGMWDGEGVLQSGDTRRVQLFNGENSKVCSSINYDSNSFKLGE